MDDQEIEPLGGHDNKSMKLVASGMINVVGSLTIEEIKAAWVWQGVPVCDLCIWDVENAWSFLLQVVCYKDRCEGKNDKMEDDKAVIESNDAVVLE